MIYNKLTLWCSKHEQVMLFESCKSRNCQSISCLFKKITTRFGEKLWSNRPLRVGTITAVEEKLEQLTQPIPVVRTPVISPFTPTMIVTTDEKIYSSAKSSDEKAEHIESIQDIIRSDIESMAKGLT